MKRARYRRKKESKKVNPIVKFNLERLYIMNQEMKMQVNRLYDFMEKHK